MTKQEYNDRLNRIETDYKTAKEKLKEEFLATTEPKFKQGDWVTIYDWDALHRVEFVDGVGFNGEFVYMLINKDRHNRYKASESIMTKVDMPSNLML